jgi:hypothetical protein
MDKRDAPRYPDPSDPFLFALTEDERLHALDLFSDERPQTGQPPAAESDTYERVPAYVDDIGARDRALENATPAVAADTRRTSTAEPPAWASPVWAAPALAAVLTAVVVVYAVATLRVMHTNSGTIATAREQIAEPAKPTLPSVPTRAPVAVASANVPPTATEERTPIGRESLSLRPPSRSTPPVIQKHDELPIRRDPPIRPAPIPSSAEPAIVTSAVAALVDGTTEPRGLSIAPGPLPAVPATLPRAEAMPAPVSRVPAPETAIQAVLNSYRTAYRELDTDAALAIWPNVDAKALRKAFDRLERQDLMFDSCQIAVHDVRAVASCRGFAWYVPRVGNKDPHDEQRQWEFKLSRVDDAWLIDTVAAR